MEKNKKKVTRCDVRGLGELRNIFVFFFAPICSYTTRGTVLCSYGRQRAYGATYLPS